MTISVNGIPVFDTNRNACVNSLYIERGIAVGSNVSLLTSPMWGAVAGYVSGGQGGSPVGFKNNIEKFPFATDAGTTCVGALSATRSQVSGNSSEQHGYTTGGLTSPTAYCNNIDKFPFATNTNAIDVGDLTTCSQNPSGYSSIQNGYSLLGYTLPAAVSSCALNKFPFTTDSNATSPGNLQNTASTGGISSLYAGYSTGPSTCTSNYIEKFPFSTELTSGCVGSLFLARGSTGQLSSCTHGYATGGLWFASPTSPYASGNWVSTIDKFPFSAEGAATSVGTLSNSCGRANAAGVSASQVGYGYTLGGYNYPTFSYLRCVDKINFSTDTNASCIGLLTESRSLLAGQQV